MVAAGFKPRLGVQGVLLDLGGVVYVGSSLLPGAVEALQLLRDASLPVRFITNTTRQPKRELISRLQGMGLAIGGEELLTPAQIARDFLIANSLSPHLLVHERLEEDFAGLPPGASEAVIIGDVGSALTYDRLNAAYRKLEEGAPLLALARNRNFLDSDHLPSLDAGPFVVALEYATGREATVLGKPSPAFFELAARSMGCPMSDAVMIGDDAEADIGGAMDAGVHGILVRTGKYREGAERRLPDPPTHIADDFLSAVNWLLDAHD